MAEAKLFNGENRRSNLGKLAGVEAIAGDTLGD